MQGFSLIGARHVPHFWLQLISVILALLIGFLFLRGPAQGLLTNLISVGASIGYLAWQVRQS